MINSYYLAAFVAGLTPDPNFTVSQWADTYRVLPRAGGSVEPGRWHTDRHPLLKEIMDCLSPSHPARKVVVVKPSQSGGTEIGVNWIGCIAHLTPSGILGILPTVETATKWSKIKLQPTIDETPVLAEIFSNERDKEKHNTILIKNFRGGYLALAGSNSPSGLRMLTSKYIYGDEISAFAPSASEEGDPLKLAEARAANYHDRKIYYVSTPTIDGFCRITQEYLESDQRKYHVPCPFCGEFQLLEWPRLKFDKEDLTKPVMYECQHCKELIPEHMKTDMLTHGRWVADNPGSNVAGFWWNALYNPFGWRSWLDIVQDFLIAKDDRELLKVWTNTVLAQTWKEDIRKIDDVELYTSREIYPAQVPDGVALLTCGVDVQKDRLVVSVYGFGINYECWLIEHFEIPGLPLQNDVWTELDNILQKVYTDKHGNTYSIICTCIDSSDGNTTQMVYSFCKSREHRFIFSIKGVGGVRPMVSQPTRTNIAQVPLYSLGVDQIKDSIFGKIKQHRFHIPDNIDVEYCKQIAGEAPQITTRKGFAVREWIKIYENHALDTAVYAHAACYIRRPTLTDSEYNMIMQTKTGVVVDLKQDQDQPTPAVQPQQVQHGTTVIRPMGRNYRHARY